jgi:uncharacterized membrane protein YbhN (UPF0104 family)
MSGPWTRLRALAAPAEERDRRRRALRLAGLAVVVAFAAVGAARVELGAVARAVGSAHPGHLCVAIAACVANLVFHAFRWAAVVPPQPRRVDVRAVLDAMVAGFAVGIVVPARAGDLVRAHLLARRAGLSTAAVVGAAAVDYVLGTVTLVPLIVVTGVATPLPDWARHALLVTSIGAAAGIALVLLLRPAPAPPAGRVAGASPGAAGLVARVRSGLAAAHDPLALGRAFGWGLAGWTAELAMAWATLAAVGVEPTVPLASLVVVATAAANAAAVSPGNAGPFELAAMLPLTGVGVAPAPALAFALLLHVVHLAPAAALGGLALAREAREARGDAGGALRAGEEAR